MNKKQVEYARLVRLIGADRLRAVRAETGQSQAEFAKHVGLAVKTYGNYERQHRELPQSVRLAIIDQTDMDPLPIEDLRAALPERSCHERKRPALKAKGGSSFLSEIRAECQHYRESNYSRPARVMLSIRDNAFAAATVYAWIDMMAHRLGISSAMDRETADILLVISFALILMLIVPVFSEFPVSRVFRHFLGRS